MRFAPTGWSTRRSRTHLCSASKVVEDFKKAIAAVAVATEGNSLTRDTVKTHTPTEVVSAASIALRQWWMAHRITDLVTCPVAGSFKARLRIEPGLGLAATRDVVDDESHEVIVAVGDRDVLDCVGGRFARPGGLARRAVSFEARA